jgi:starch synthase
MNILFATSEAFPLIKTGGLADVAGALPLALDELGEKPRLILPAYPIVLERLEKPRVVATTRHYEQDVRLLEGVMPGSNVPVYLVDCPAAFGRPGNPYVADNGQDWPDNAWRFALFCQVVVDVALNRLGLDWPVDVVHCNDWQTGLVPALLSLFDDAPATVFTIHNLAYQGIFPAQTYFDLGLPVELWTSDGVEFYDWFSFIKGGLVFADRISTVSPSYAREIMTGEFGYGLEGLLLHRADRLSGVLNGIDTRIWNPSSDSLIAQNFDTDSLQQRAVNKHALQTRFGLKPDPDTLVLGLISRLVAQKGLDMILEVMPYLLELPLQMVFLGSGGAGYEQSLTELADLYPDRVGVEIGYDEALSHQIEAGCDLFLMPSLFEPCGLNQLYSLRYGALPLVTPVGGLADSVIDASLDQGNGFVLAHPNTWDLVASIKRALDTWQQPDQWRQLQLNAMSVDHSWNNSAVKYLELYRLAMA